MQTAQLLTQLASAGVTLRRVAGDSFEVFGDLTPTLQQSLRDAKPELLVIFPEPGDPFEDLWSRTLDEANAQVPDTWFGMPWDWAKVDGIEDRFFIAKAAGDLQAAQRAAADYIALFEHFGALEKIHVWADRTLSQEPTPLSQAAAARTVAAVQQAIAAHRIVSDANY